MSVRVFTNHIYNFKRVVTIPTKYVGQVEDKKVRECSYGLEKLNQDYIKSELKL